MSIINITFLDQVIPNDIFISNNSLKTRFYFYDYIEISLFLESLDTDQTYVVTFDFILSWLMYEEENPFICLSKPILITKNSDSRVISKFLNDQIRLACDVNYLDDSILEDKKDGDSPGIIVNFSKINLF